MRETSLAFLDPEPQDAGIFNQACGGWNNDGRRITRPVNEIGLEDDGRAELARFCLNAGIKIYDVEPTALDFHRLIGRATSHPSVEQLLVLLFVGRRAAAHGFQDLAAQPFLFGLLFQGLQGGPDDPGLGGDPEFLAKLFNPLLFFL